MGTDPIIIKNADNMKKEYIKKRKQDYLIATAYRYLCKPFVMMLVNTRVTPNMVTLFSLIVLIPLCAYGTYLNNFYLTAFMIQFVYMFDVVDGDLARNKSMSTPLGAKLDNVVDHFFYILYYSLFAYCFKIHPAVLIAYLFAYVFYGVFATYYIVPHLKQINNIKRFPVKQMFWEKGILFGMDISFQDLVVSVSLLLKKPAAGLMVVSVLWIVDLLYRLLELSVNIKKNGDKL